MDLHIAPNGLIRKACIRLAFHFYRFSVLRDGEQIVAIVPDKTLRCLLLMQEVTAIRKPLHAVDTGFYLGEISHQLVNGAVKLAIAVYVGIHAEHSAGEKLTRILMVGFLYLHVPADGFIEKTLARFRLQGHGFPILFNGERVIAIIPDKAFRSLFFMEKIIAIEQLLHAVDTRFRFSEIAHQLIGIRIKFSITVGIGINGEYRAGEQLFSIFAICFLNLYISTNGFVEKTLARFRLQSDGLSILFDGERIIPIIPDKTFRGLFLMEKVVAVKQLFHAVDTGFCLGEIAHQFVGISVKFPVAVGIGVDSEQSPS